MNLIAVKRNEKVLVACRVTIKEVDAEISRAVYIYDAGASLQVQD